MSSYNYEREKPWLGTNDGTRTLLRLYDWVNAKDRTSGAFTCGRAVEAANGPFCADSFKALAALDRLVELGVVEELPGQTGMSQHRVLRKVRA